MIRISADHGTAFDIAGTGVATAFGCLLLDRPLRIVTNNLAPPPRLARAPGIDLVLLGAVCGRRADGLAPLPRYRTGGGASPMRARAS